MDTTSRDTALTNPATLRDPLHRKHPLADLAEPIEQLTGIDVTDARSPSAVAQFFDHAAHGVLARDGTRVCLNVIRVGRQRYASVADFLHFAEAVAAGDRRADEQKAAQKSRAALPPPRAGKARPKERGVRTAQREQRARALGL